MKEKSNQMDPIKAERMRRGAPKPTNENEFGFIADAPHPVGQLESSQSIDNMTTNEQLIAGAKLFGAGRLIGLEDDETLELVSRTVRRQAASDPQNQKASSFS